MADATSGGGIYSNSFAGSRLVFSGRGNVYYCRHIAKHYFVLCLFVFMKAYRKSFPIKKLYHYGYIGFLFFYLK
jgi:hypothetical protein